MLSPFRQITAESLPTSNDPLPLLHLWAIIKVLPMLIHNNNESTIIIVELFHVYWFSYSWTIISWTDTNMNLTNKSKSKTKKLCTAHVQVDTHVHWAYACVLQFWPVNQSNSVCDRLCMCCTQVRLCVLHDSKKHVSHVLLCVACKLTAILYQRRFKAYSEMICK